MSEPTELHIRTAGSRAGNTVVLLHSLALDGTVWDRALDGLKQCDVVVPDLPGHGRSAHIPGTTVEAMADQVVAGVRASDRAVATVVGLSLGGCVALAIAQRHPEFVTGLGLVDTTAWYGEDALQTWSERAARAEAEGLDALRGFQLERWFSPEFSAKEPQEVARLGDVFVSNELANYRAACTALGTADLRAGLAGIRVPTVVIVGEDDYATPLAMAEALRDGIGPATLVRLPGRRHLTPIEAPRDVVEALRPIVAAAH